MSHEKRILSISEILSFESLLIFESGYKILLQVDNEMTLNPYLSCIIGK